RRHHRRRRADHNQRPAHRVPGPHRGAGPRPLRILPRIRLAGRLSGARHRLRGGVGRTRAMKSKLTFVVRFLAVFALLIVAGWFTNAPKRYAAALRVAASITSPLANGWSLEQRAAATGRQEIWFRRG